MKTIPAIRDTRAILFGLAAISIIVAAGRGGPLVTRWQDRSVQAIRYGMERRAREEVLSRQLPSLRAQRRHVVELESRLDSAEVTASDAVGAGAGLMSAILEVADDAGVDVSSTRLDGSVENQGSPRRTTVEIMVSGGLEDLVVFLSTIEAGPPAADVTDVSISRAGGTAGSSGAGRLQATVKIEALVRRPSE